MIESSLLIAQQSPPPHFDGTYALLLLSRVAHIMGAIILVGGLFYIRYIVSPANASSDTAPVDQLLGGQRGTWAKWVGIATALLLITGFVNFFAIRAQNEKFASSYQMIFGLKVLAGFALFALAALLTGRTSAAESLRQKWRMWLTTSLLLGILTVVFGSVLRSYPHVPKAKDPNQPQLVAPANSQ
jgi:uncharacterized membrane protein